MSTFKEKSYNKKISISIQSHNNESILVIRFVCIEIRVILNMWSKKKNKHVSLDSHCFLCKDERNAWNLIESEVVLHLVCNSWCYTFTHFFFLFSRYLVCRLRHVCFCTWYFLFSYHWTQVNLCTSLNLYKNTRFCFVCESETIERLTYFFSVFYLLLFYCLYWDRHQLYCLIETHQFKFSFKFICLFTCIIRLAI